MMMMVPLSKNVPLHSELLLFSRSVLTIVRYIWRCDRDEEEEEEIKEIRSHNKLYLNKRRSYVRIL